MGLLRVSFFSRYATFWMSLVALAASTASAQHAPDSGTDAETLATPTEASVSGLDPVLLAAIAVSTCLFLGVAGMVVYFFVLTPARRRKPFLQARSIINSGSGSKDEYQSAEALLTQALTAGMRNDDIREARFLLGYVRAMLNDFGGAAAVLGELRKDEQVSKETLYLDLYVHHKLEKYHEVLECFKRARQDLTDYLQSNLIVAVACLNLAQRHWRRREIEAAKEYYGLMRELGELEKEIPPRIDDHQVVLGVIALYDKRFEEAREKFEGAANSAKDAGLTSRHADVGLLLCQWCEEDLPKMASAFADLASSIRPEYEALPDEIKNSKQRSGEQLSDDEETRLLYRNTLLLTAVATLFEWLRLPENKGLDREKHKALRAQLIAIFKVDKEMPDPILIAGLLDYYFAKNADERKAALKELKKAMELGAQVPEVGHLIEAEDKLEAMSRDAVEHFYGLCRNYLENKTVPLHLRTQLKERLERYARFKDVGEEVDLGSEDETIQPTMMDIQSRENLLRGRLERIVRPRLNQADPEQVNVIESQLDQLRDAIDSLGERVEEVERKQQDALGSMGEFLLNEEEATHADSEPELAFIRADVSMPDVVQAQNTPSADLPDEEEADNA